ncbi:hypothetical protein CVU82_01760 [Candidatus Falkowbacteria bacterium HGW-Falkowbacteria-1]|uniref:Capsule synthesis protein CapA domain-containing protein n=1 Tax=Candidatus Falkowbacteria bacterium HGW-Falkowbacteria-1 TaxID=2013768 RepID=A0A2N2E9B1_9BACT|nr:MAG: hypothetical protein CVU82_01760 [Candidatus Falkowbacteria bacterium HGW-Falkowbacteria-1]
MKGRIVWVILFSVLGIFIAIFESDKVFDFSVLSFSKDGSTNKQEEVKKNFLTFLEQKKKITSVDDGVSLIAVGDISYSRGVERMVKAKGDINYPFLEIKDYLKNSDLVFANLETPITEGREISDFEMVFRSNPGTEQALKDAGFSIMSLANNHTPNFGERGLLDTFACLDRVNIVYSGAGKNNEEADAPVYIERKGIRFAFLSYNDFDVVPAYYEASENRAGTAFMRIEKMNENVKKAKENSDFVIISMHSGTEYVDNPNNSQINFAHSAIDAGADMVIGHHPHVVQTVEEYKGKFIFYSLGNFVFDQSWSQDTTEALLVKIYFTKNGISKISFLPVVSDNLVQVKVADREEAKKIITRLKLSLDESFLYFWNNGKGDFEKETRSVIYQKELVSKNIFSKEESADLDNDSVLEKYILENGVIKVFEMGNFIWQSPVDWWVDDFALVDSDNSGNLNLNLSLWKEGNFGSSKPFWIKENDMSIKNHFFIYEFSVDKEFKQVWSSSNLAVPNCEFKIGDVDMDGKNDLIVIEGSYLDDFSCKGNYVAVWKWNSWGFSNEWRSESGVFSNLELEKNNNETFFTVDFSR